jgi:hypothetical protein
MPKQVRLDGRGTLHHVMVRGIAKRKMVTTPAMAHALKRAESK